MENIRKHSNLIIDRTLDALRANNMQGYYFENCDDYFQCLTELIEDGQSVSFGGSATLNQTETLAWLKGRNITLLDRDRAGISAKEREDVQRQAFQADVFITSSNAITETGNLYNVDGKGNRVAAMIYGPKRVIVVAGINKIVTDDAAAIERNRKISAPINAMRLGCQTPCASLGYCTDCMSPQRICSAYVFLRHQMIKDRIHVILLNKAFGY